jgi:hypothetical protein
MANTTSTQRATLRDADWRWIRQLFPRNLDALAKKTDGDVRKAVHHCADDQIYPWKLQGILS